MLNTTKYSFRSHDDIVKGFIYSHNPHKHTAREFDVSNRAFREYLYENISSQVNRGFTLHSFPSSHVAVQAL